MMKVIQLMWVASILAWILAAPTHSNRGCLCLAGQPCWPSESEWNTFNSSIGGKLTVITPVGAPCHDPTFNSALCGNVALQYTNSTWRSDQIGISSFCIRPCLTPFYGITSTNILRCPAASQLGGRSQSK